MAATIPVSQIVTVNPAVVGTGGNSLQLSSVFITQSALAPWGSIVPFSSASDVGLYFGTSSTEYSLAQIYFAGFDNSTKKPGTLFFTRYATAPIAANLRGSSLAGVALATIKSVTGSLSVTVDGTAKTAASLNLSAATSFSNAATLITTALGTGVTCTWDATTSVFVLTSSTTGVASTITVATGTTAASLGLAAGIVSQGAIADAPATFMPLVATYGNNWATFLTVWAATSADAQAFATWSNAQNGRYLYVAWDNASDALTANNATALGTILNTAAVDGSMVVYDTTPKTVAFVAGMIASIDWNSTNGRITGAFKTQSGLPTVINTLAQANNLLTNYTNYYGLYSAPGPNNTYNILYDGRVPGKWKWMDTYVNQIFLNAQLQLAIFNGLLSVNSAPYNDLGYSFIKAWCADPINQALNNGSIRTGAPLSAAQKAAINSVAGGDISTELFTQGYYLQVLPASAQTRDQRQSPPVKLWYMDGGAIQQITLASIAVL